jgi:hypothetical protein
VPTGPLQPPAAMAGTLAEPPAADLLAAAQQADLLLTFAELDPAVGGEYLSTWAEAAVAVFTSGRTRAERAYAVGEMLRLSGVRTITGVLTGADKTDGSLGIAPGRDDAVPSYQGLAGAVAPEPGQPGNDEGSVG